jgi:hypothetical protein
MFLSLPTSAPDDQQKVCEKLLVTRSLIDCQLMMFSTVPTRGLVHMGQLSLLAHFGEWSQQS